MLKIQYQTDEQTYEPWTCITNVHELAHLVSRLPEYIVTYIAMQLAKPFRMDRFQAIYMIYGIHSVDTLEHLFEEFVRKNCTCSKCDSYNTIVMAIKILDRISIICNDCFHVERIAKSDIFRVIVMRYGKNSDDYIDITDVPDDIRNLHQNCTKWIEYTQEKLTFDMFEDKQNIRRIDTMRQSRYKSFLPVNMWMRYLIDVNFSDNLFGDPIIQDYLVDEADRMNIRCYAMMHVSHILLEGTSDILENLIRYRRFFYRLCAGTENERVQEQFVNTIYEHVLQRREQYSSHMCNILRFLYTYDMIDFYAIKDWYYRPRMHFSENERQLLESIIQPFKQWLENGKQFYYKLEHETKLPQQQQQQQLTISIGDSDNSTDNEDEDDEEEENNDSDDDNDEKDESIAAAAATTTARNINSGNESINDDIISDYSSDRTSSDDSLFDILNLY